VEQWAISYLLMPFMHEDHHAPYYFSRKHQLNQPCSAIAFHKRSIENPDRSKPSHKTKSEPMAYITRRKSARLYTHKNTCAGLLFLIWWFVVPYMQENNMQYVHDNQLLHLRPLCGAVDNYRRG